jgi:hypothetical protein
MGDFLLKLRATGDIINVNQDVIKKPFEATLASN